MKTKLLLNTLITAAFTFAMGAGNTFAGDVSESPMLCSIEETFTDSNGVEKDYPVRWIEAKQVPTQFGYTVWTIGKIEKIFDDVYATSPLATSHPSDLLLSANFIEEDGTLRAEVNHGELSFTASNYIRRAVDSELRKVSIEAIQALDLDKEMSDSNLRVTVTCELTQ